MQKITLSLLGFFIFGLISVKMNPRGRINNNSRSIASTGHGLVANNFLIKFEKEKVSQQDVELFVAKNNKALVEDFGELMGEIIEYDMSAPHKIEYFLITPNGEKSPIQLANEPAPELIGKEVEFTGFDDNGKKYGAISSALSTRGVGIGIPQLEEDKYPMFRPERMLMLFFKFDSSPTTHITMQAAKAHVYGAYRTIYDDMSDGKLKHQIDVSGWHHLARDENAAPGSSVCHVSSQEIKDAILADNLDVMDYDNISIMSNCDSYFTMGGRANLGAYDWLGVGRKSTYVRMAGRSDLYAIGTNPDVPGWTSFTSILVHERGHNFGLMHSNALDCGSNQFLQDCTYIEYGNRFDRMGGPDSTYTFNADQQRIAGWKSEVKDFHHIKESGTYFIDRLTTDNTDRKIGAYLYLPGTDTKTMMLEYRQAHKADNRLQKYIFRNIDKGIHLYSRMGSSNIDKSPSIGNSFRYIDSKPTELDWHQDTSYESMDDSYYDPVTGATIYMQGISGTKAMVYVEFDPEKQVCYKKEIKDKVARPFITRYAPIEKVEILHELAPAIEPGTRPRPIVKPSVRSRSRRTRKARAISRRNASRRRPAAFNVNKFRQSIHIKQKHIVLIPGDDFRVRPESMLADALYCPRTRINLEWTNASQFFPWIKQDPSTGGGGVIISQNGGGKLTGGNTRPPGGGEHDRPVTSFYSKKTFDNYDEEYDGYPELTVPASSLGKNYQMRFKSIDSVTGQEIVHKVYVYIRAKHDAIIAISPEKAEY